jgi:hypothetical protein
MPAQMRSPGRSSRQTSPLECLLCQMIPSGHVFTLKATRETSSRLTGRPSPTLRHLIKKLVWDVTKMAVGLGAWMHVARAALRETRSRALRPLLLLRDQLQRLENLHCRRRGGLQRLCHRGATLKIGCGTAPSSFPPVHMTGWPSPMLRQQPSGTVAASSAPMAAASKRLAP